MEAVQDFTPAGDSAVTVAGPGHPVGGPPPEPDGRHEVIERVDRLCGGWGRSYRLMLPRTGAPTMPTPGEA